VPPSVTDLVPPAAQSTRRTAHARALARTIAGGAMFFSGALFVVFETGPWFLGGFSVPGLVLLVTGGWLMLRSGRA